MIDLENELRQVLSALAVNGIDYGLCGGLGMAVHGLPRATVDIDVLVNEAEVPRIFNLAKNLGYVLEAAPMTFADGRLRIHRVSKIDPESGDILPLDLLCYDDAIRTAVRFVEVDWNGLTIQVVDRASLRMLKELRGSAQDRADIEALQEGLEHEDEDK
jgi:hypothetical protein